MTVLGNNHIKLQLYVKMFKVDWEYFNRKFKESHYLYAFDWILHRLWYSPANFIYDFH